jgi:hypothetical protein
MLAMIDLHWAAGFIEGEGTSNAKAQQRKNDSGGRGLHNQWNGTIGYEVCVTACQVEKGPLEKLSSLFGGNVRFYKSKRKNESDIHEWSVHGAIASGLMMTLWPLMGDKRKRQIEEALAKWRSVPPQKRNMHSLLCVRGHSIENIGTKGRCKICRRIKHRAKHLPNEKAHIEAWMTRRWKADGMRC